MASTCVLSCAATACASSGGTALPICVNCTFMLPDNLNASGNDCSRAASLRDTRPEMIVRRGLHKLGYRFRLHAKICGTRPDLVFRRHKAVVFVHGCFWHQHKGCKYASKPKSNQAFWHKKFGSNLERDEKNLREL